ncbi:MAG: mechanosensitive ion channel family protein [Pigmentiphaga sp.]|nr:mechanosensitive ion channel family protein [Pigmentiphaga sp.]
MRFLLLLLFCLGLVPPTQAVEPQGLIAPINRSSPSEVYQSFLAAASRIESDYAEYAADKRPERVAGLRRDLQRMRQLMDLEALPPAARVKAGNSAIGYLYDILARLPPLDPASIPGYRTGPLDAGKPLPDKWTIPGTDLQIVRTESGPHAGEYQFSARTLASLPEYYQAVVDREVLNPRVYPFFHREQIAATGPWIPDAFVRGMPEPLKVYYLNTPLWKILLILGVVLLSLGLAGCWAWFAWRASNTEVPVSRLGWRLTIPVAIILLFSASEWFVAAQINPAGSFAIGEYLFATVLYYTAAAWATWLLIYFIVESIIRSPRVPENSYDAHLLRLSARLLGIVAVSAILVDGANEVGIPALGLIAGLGVGGIAVALASQSTIENLFGGLSLFADRPFRIGDHILFEGQSAKVERIGPRSSRLRARDGTLCTVPNADLAKIAIVNFTQRSCCYLEQRIALRGDSQPDRILALLYRLRALLEAEEMVIKEPGWPRVRVEGTAPGRIELRVRASIHTADYAVFLEVQERIVLKALIDLADLGLALAAPLELAREPAAPAAAP